MNRLLTIPTTLLFCLFLACTPRKEKSQLTAKSVEKLDESRANVVKNTPSRPSGKVIHTETYLLPDPHPDSVISALPEEASIPEGMVFVPGGRFEMGSTAGLPLERPVKARIVLAYYMDEHPVTVDQYRKFVVATKYRTEAEAFGDAGTFDLKTRSWGLTKGANWEYPLGPDVPAAPGDHPVTQVSWQDAVAYCEWAGKRLPTEVEWEHAARNAANTREIYNWGNQIAIAGQYRANIWQGHFPLENTNEDGYLFTSPVGIFGKSPLGLMDMSGNVWEWCQDWYLPYGSDHQSFVPNKESERVMRGGSFLCEPGWCHGYRVSGRSGTTQETSLFHVGFRCVKDLSQ